MASAALDGRYVGLPAALRLRPKYLAREFGVLSAVKNQFGQAERLMSGEIAG